MIELDGAGVVAPSGRRGVPDREILAPIDLTLSERRIAVIGANGSGKSTLLRLINGLRLPTTGDVRVLGHSTRTQARRVRSLVGFAFTDPLAQLLMSTPLEDIELSLSTTSLDRARRAVTAQALLERHGIGHLAHSSIYDISGGERQLVALLSVLSVAPTILVADEPTTLLDLRNREVLRRLVAGLDQQVVYSTHDLEFAADADRVVVVDEGRVLADGPPVPAIAAYQEAMRR